MLIIVKEMHPEPDLYVGATLDFLKGKKPDERLGEVDGRSLTLKPHDPVVVADIQRERQQRPKPIFSALRRAS